VPDNGQIVLDADLLTSRDLLRARAVLGGRNPYELLSDPIESAPLMIWCLLSRERPDLTWDEALDIPISRFAVPESDGGPPPAASPAAPGTSDATSTATASGRKRRSAATSASNRRNTTSSPSASSATGES
jgi:hypothetical protein